MVISNLLLLLESVSSWFFFFVINSSDPAHSCVHCIQLVTWGKYGATCLAHSFLSVLTIFSNKKVVHSIKSLLMLQEMAAENSAFWSALKPPLHGWHFSSIFPPTYLACGCPVKCSACLWTICSANSIFHVLQEGLECSELLIPKGQQKALQGTGSSGTVGVPAAATGFPYGSELLWTHL